MQRRRLRESGRDVMWAALRSTWAGRAELIPLGTYCQSAAALRDAGLRRWAGPFDWLHSTPRMIADCIDDDFAELLDTKNMESVARCDLPVGSKRQCHHHVFEQRYCLPPLFNHHDPLSDRIDLLKLTRGVERLRRALRARHDKTFVMLSMYERSEDDLERLVSTLRAVAPSNRLVVITTQVAPRRAWTQTRTGGDLAMACLRVTSPSTGVRFENPDDDKFLTSILMDLAKHTGIKSP